MSIRTIAAAVAIGAVCAAAPGVASAGGEIQAYERSYSSYAAVGPAPGAYAAPMPASYARPMGAYYGGGAAYGGGNPCASMPYGYSHASVGVGGNDFLTAGLLGVGIGYLLFH